MGSIQIPVRPKIALPEDFTLTLQRMQEDGDPELSPLLARVKKAGWTYQDIADALGITRQAVEQRVKFPDRRPRVAVSLAPEVAARLRELQATARTVNGAMPPEHPARRDSEELSRMLAEQIERGAPVYTLAKAIGVTHGAVVARLYRHGYRDHIPASQSKERYLNRKIGDVAT